MIPLSITTRTISMVAVLAFLLLCAALPADAGVGRDPLH